MAQITTKWISDGAVTPPKLDQTGNFYIGSLHTVADATIGGNLSVTGRSTLVGVLNLTDATLSRGLRVGTDATIVGGLSVDDQLYVDSDATIVGGLKVIGNTSLTGVLNLTDATILRGLYVGTDETVVGGLSVGQNTTLAKNLYVTLDSTMTGGLSVDDQLYVDSDATVVQGLSTRALYVSQDSTFTGGVSIGKGLRVGTDETVVGGLSVGQNTTLAKNLYVTLDSTMTGGLSVDDQLYVDSDATVVQGLSTRALYVSQDSTLSGGLSVDDQLYVDSDATVVNGFSTKALYVSQDSTLSGGLYVDDQLRVNRDATVVNGFSTKALYVSQDSTLSGGLYVDDSLTVNRDSTIAGGAHIEKTFTTSGLVGINTSTPAAQLAINGGVHVGGDSNPGDNNLLVDGNITTGTLSSTGDMTVSGGLHVVKMTSTDGPLGINTIAPSGKLHVKEVAGDEFFTKGNADGIILTNNNLAKGIGLSASVNGSYSGTGSVGIKLNEGNNVAGAGVIRFYTEGTEAMTLTNGKLGLNQTSPNDRIEIFGSNAALRFTRSSGDRYGRIRYTGTEFVFNAPVSDSIVMATSSDTAIMTFTAAAAYTNVSLGVNMQPLAPFHVYGITPYAEGYNSQILVASAEAYSTSPTSGIFFSNKYDSGGNQAGMGGIVVGKNNTTDGNYGSYLSLWTRVHGSGVAEKLRIDSLGNVGIGVVIPGAKLEVGGDVKVNTIAHETGDVDTFLVSNAGLIKYRTGAEILSDIGAAAQLHGLSSTTFHSSSIANTYVMIANSSGLPAQGTNTDAQISSTVSASHAQQHNITSTANHTSSATSGRMLQADANGLPINATNTDAQVSSAVSLAHAQSHSITSTANHTSSATSGRMLQADANGLPINATNTDAQVSSAVSNTHARAHTITSTSDHNAVPSLVSYVYKGDGNGLPAASVIYQNNTEIGVGTTGAGAKLAINGGVHVGGDTDPGDNNLEVDGNITIDSGNFTITTGNIYMNAGEIVVYGGGLLLDSDLGTIVAHGNTIRCDNYLGTAASVEAWGNGDWGDHATATLRAKMTYDPYGNSQLILENSDGEYSLIQRNGHYETTFAGNNALNIVDSHDRPIAFFQAGNERMRIDAGGYVSIGTVTPISLLTVKGNVYVGGDVYDPKLEVVSTTSSSNTWPSLKAQVTADNAGMARLVLTNDSYEEFTIEKNCSQRSDYGGPNSVNLVNTGSFPITFNTNYTERLRIHTGGQIGINTSSPAAQLAINGGVHVGGDSDPGDNNLLVDGDITVGNDAVVLRYLSVRPTASATWYNYQNYNPAFLSTGQLQIGSYPQAANYIGHSKISEVPFKLWNYGNGGLRYLSLASTSYDFKMIKMSSDGKYVLPANYFHLVSNDYGATFTNLGAGAYWSSAISASGQFMMLSRSGGTPISRDWGVTWDENAPQVQVGSQGSQVSMSADGRIMIISGTLGSVYTYKSEDFGITWQDISGQVPNRGGPNAMSSDGKIMAFGSQAGSGFYMSYDGGLTFNYTGINSTCKYVSMSSDGRYVAYMSGGSANISKDYGRSWNAVLYAGAFEGYVAMSSSGQYMAVVLPTSGVYVSTNWGASFFNSVPGGYTYRAVGISPDGHTYLIYTDQGIHRLLMDYSIDTGLKINDGGVNTESSKLQVTGRSNLNGLVTANQGIDYRISGTTGFAISYEIWTVIDAYWSSNKFIFDTNIPLSKTIIEARFSVDIYRHGTPSYIFNRRAVIPEGSPGIDIANQYAWVEITFINSGGPNWRVNIIPHFSGVDGTIFLQNFGQNKKLYITYYL